MKPVDSFVGMCVHREYLSQDEAQWLRYALERRIISITTFIPLAIIGCLITDPSTVLAFFITFCTLRTRTNGFHAKSVSRCFLYSLLGELLFLNVLPSVWNDIIAFIALTASGLLIWFLAPFNHPNMNFSSEEVNACAKSAKERLSMLFFTLVVLYVWKQHQLALGILLGIVMTASTLIIAYCSQKTMPEENC